MSRHNRERRQYRALKKQLIPLTPYQQIRLMKGGKKKLQHVRR